MSTHVLMIGGACLAALAAAVAQFQNPDPAQAAPGFDTRFDARFESSQVAVDRETGRVTTTGVFVPFSHVGLVDIGAEDATNDTGADDAVTSVAHRSSDSFNPKAVSIGNSRVAGITHLATVPGSSGNVFAGTGSIVTTDGTFRSVVVEDAFVYAVLGERGSLRSGGSRSSSMAQLRRAFREAAGGLPPATHETVLTPEDRRALRPAVRGEMPMVIAANRASDLMGLVRLKDRYSDLDLIVLGAKEAWQVADALADAGIKVMIDPHDNLPEGFDAIGARLDNAVILDAAGVEYAFTTASADLTHNVRVITQHAGNAVGNGLAWDKAWAAITTTPASWFGVDLSDTEVVWDGDPLELASRPVSMRIGGEEVELRSRQIALRERYMPGTADERAHKYR